MQIRDFSKTDRGWERQKGGTVEVTVAGLLLNPPYRLAHCGERRAGRWPRTASGLELGLQESRVKMLSDLPRVILLYCA